MEELKAALPAQKVLPVTWLLAILFPYHAKLFLGDRLTRAEAYIASQNRRGLATEAGYDSYFALHPSADAVPKSVIDTIFNNLDDSTMLMREMNSYLGKTNTRGDLMIGLLLTDIRFRLGGQPRPNPTQALLDALLSVADYVFRIPWGGALALEPSHLLSFAVRDLLDAWGVLDSGKHLMVAFEKCASTFSLAEIYVERGRELVVFPGGGESPPVISKEDFDMLGAVLLRKIFSSADDGSLAGSPFFGGTIRCWMYLGGESAAKMWLAKGMESSGKFTAKVAKGLVRQSISRSGVVYQFIKEKDKGLFDSSAVYESAKRHLLKDSDLTDEDRRLLEAIVAGVEDVRMSKSATPHKAKE